MRKTAGAEARAVRLTKMQELVEAGGPLPIKLAAHRLDVTEMTIRRDLSAPESPLSALGGYVLAALLPGAERYSLDEASDQHAANKRLACERAAEWVQPHDSLFIDCGTTMVHFAEALPPDMPLSVVCYSTNIAAVLSRRPNTQLMLMGGLFHPSSATFFSDEGLQYLNKLGVNKAFISAGGLDPERGASCSNFHEVPVKQAAIRSASQSFLVVDESKLGTLRPAFFSPLDAFARIAVGGVVAAAVKKQFKQLPMEFARAS
ncbi:DeoR/GlpR family DNA-binding transcription regulator [Variovorax sp. H27-G14]|uniref:DeoR/GlpR family DNA-binding transcription regulator n=1 Tax=Variovorax sp. H27-G14 TaxID=3111914 RepID=UPI0038FD0CBA